MIEPKQEKMLVQSPLIPKIKNGKNYRVYFYKTAARKKVFNKHIDKIIFSLPVVIAEKMGIEPLP